MKNLIQVLKLVRSAVVCAILILACKPDELGVDPTKKNPADTLTAADLDKFSDHLQFFSAVKKPGKSPAAPGGSSLKTNIKDTLRLVQGVVVPVRFLHLNSTDNVTGVYVQVVSTVGGQRNLFL